MASSTAMYMEMTSPVDDSGNARFTLWWDRGFRLSAQHTEVPYRNGFVYPRGQYYHANPREFLKNQKALGRRIISGAPPWKGAYEKYRQRKEIQCHKTTTV